MASRNVYNYKKALTVPFMVQKLWRGVTLENPVELSKIIVFGTTVFLFMTVLRHLMWFFSLMKGVKVAAYVLIPIGTVMLWDKIEPDGMKISAYIFDC